MLDTEYPASLLFMLDIRCWPDVRQITGYTAVLSDIAVEDKNFATKSLITMQLGSVRMSECPPKRPYVMYARQSVSPSIFNTYD